MAGKAKASKATAEVLGHNPFDGEQLLLDAVFGRAEGYRRVPSPADRKACAPAPRVVASASPPETPAPSAKPDHYKVVSISLYTEDIELLDNYVKELKRRGHYKANKSQVIRQALAQLDLNQISNDR